MRERVIGELMLWGISAGMALLVAHQAVLILSDKLNEVARALSAF
jgi:hypothetical protein